MVSLIRRQHVAFFIDLHSPLSTTTHEALLANPLQTLMLLHHDAFSHSLQRTPHSVTVLAALTFMLLCCTLLTDAAGTSTKSTPSRLALREYIAPMEIPPVCGEQGIYCLT